MPVPWLVESYVLWEYSTIKMMQWKQKVFLFCYLVAIKSVLTLFCRSGSLLSRQKALLAGKNSKICRTMLWRRQLYFFQWPHIFIVLKFPWIWMWNMNQFAWKLINFFCLWQTFIVVAILAFIRRRKRLICVSPISVSLYSIVSMSMSLYASFPGTFFLLNAVVLVTKQVNVRLVHW